MVRHLTSIVSLMTEYILVTLTLIINDY